MSELMEEVQNAAVNGDVTIFSTKNKEYLLKKTYQNNNILHIAAQHQQLSFLKAALNNFPGTPTCESLVCDQNYQGNTPFHIAAEVGDEAITNRLYEFFSMQCGDTGGSDRVLPWRTLNSEGNTPAHVALLYGNVSIAKYLVEKDDNVARIVNHSKETLLHLAIQYHDLDNYETIEDLWPILELLLKRESSVTCWADTDGYTPLHRAASLEPTYCIPVIKAMLASCSEAAKAHDERSGHTILHFLTNHQVASYEQGQELLQIPQVYAVRNSKNHQGDTPLHLAVRNCDNIMVQVLLASSPKLGLKNKSGVSAGFLVRQLEEEKLTEMPVGERRKLTKAEREAAEQGNIAFLDEQMDIIGMNLLLSKTSNGGNILHILMQCNYRELIIKEVEAFIERSLQRLPLLICQKDSNGNTPIHVLAHNTKHPISLLELSSKSFEKARELARDVARVAPWRLKNVKGDTPLHVAVKAGNTIFSRKLLALDKEVAGYVNNRSETPLHLLADNRYIQTSLQQFIYHRGGISGRSADEDLIMCLTTANDNLPYMQDVDGLTPILTAVRGRNPLTVLALHQLFPDCSKIADSKGKTFWHWIVSKCLKRNLLSSDEVDAMRSICESLIKHNDNDEIKRLILSKDNDGNTPLHIAIANGQFGFAKFFLDNCRADEHITSIWHHEGKYKSLLAIENKEGVSCYNLIGSAEHLPREFEIALLKDGNLPFGYRSMYGVPTTKIEAYTNTIGVIAALLATITFTAAFTVPGGLDSSNGMPLLLRMTTFQVFLVADVVAMCSSMMVLFCLLWIMTTGRQKESILLLDVSIYLLHTNFISCNTGDIYDGSLCHNYTNYSCHSYLHLCCLHFSYHSYSGGPRAL